MRERFRKRISHNFYASRFPLVTVPQLSYSAYCTARDAWISSFTVPDNKIILDAGCGNGEAFASWTIANSVFGLDMTDRVIGEARQNGLQPLLGDMRSLPFRDQSFDIVCALAVLGIFNEPDRLCREFCRVLKPGGCVYLSVATLGGARYLTRGIVSLLNIKNQMHFIPTVNELVDFIRDQDMEIVSISASSLLPGPSIYKNPGSFARTMGAYAFIKASKK